MEPSVQETGPLPLQPPGALAETKLAAPDRFTLTVTPVAPWLPAFVAESV